MILIALLCVVLVYIMSVAILSQMVEQKNALIPVSVMVICIIIFGAIYP